MQINNCHNVHDFRKMAKSRIPAPLFHYIDGGADDETTLKRNTSSFDECDLIPNGLANVANIDLSTTILGQKVRSPLFLSPTGMNRLFHHDGERASSRAAQKYGCYYSLSTLSSVSIEEIGELIDSPKMYQIYIHKDRGLTYEFIERCKKAKFSSLCLTIDTIVAGNRERDLRSGMTMPPKFTPSSLMSFAMRPRWVYNYLTHEGFKLSSMKFATKSTFVSGGNELFKEYYIDELKAIFTIASASYSLKSNLNEIKGDDLHSDEYDECINDRYVNSSDAYYGESEHILL